MAVQTQTPQRPSGERITTPLIPNYRMIRSIGEGSYGQVWLAQDVLGHYRAVKIVYRARFASLEPYNRELNGIKAYEPISRSHDGLIDILTVGTDEQNGFFYYVMELADDETNGSHVLPQLYQPRTLQSCIGERGLPIQACIRIGGNLANGLAALHRNKLLHRDIKPCSLLFVNGEPKLADVGMVSHEGRAKSYVGTEGYIPPEGPNSYQADIFALGKVLYQMATGHLVEQYPEWPSSSPTGEEQTLFIEFNEIIFKACAAEPEERHRSAEQLVAELSLIQAGHSLRTVRRLEIVKRVAKRAARPAAVLLMLLLAIAVLRERVHRTELRQAKSQGVMTDGDRKVQEGDLFAAVSYFADALTIDPGHEELCRLKMGATLGASPRLEQIAYTPAHLHFGAFSPRGDLLITAEADGGLQLRNATDLSVLGERFYHGNGKDARTARFDPAQRMLVTSGSDNAARLWDVQTQRELYFLPHEEEVVSAVFSPDSRYVLTAAGNKAFLWDLSMRKRVGSFVGHGAKVRHVAFSPDGERVLTASEDASACLWSTSDQKLIRPFWHKSWVYYATFSPDGHYVATASYDKSACVWNATTGLPIRILTLGAAVVAVDFSPDGRYLATAGWDSTARIWHWRSGKAVTPAMHHVKEVWHIAFSPEGRKVMTLGWDKTLRLWNLADDDLESRPLTEYYSETGSHYYEKTPGGIIFRRTADRALLGEGHIPHLRAVFQNQNGDTVITVAHGGPTNSIQCWKNGLPTSTRLANTNAEIRWVISQDGTYAACIVAEKIDLWDIKRSLRVAQFPHFGKVKLAEFSPDHRFLCSAAKTNAYLWRLAPLSLKPTLLIHEANVAHLTFSPDNERLVTGCSDRSMQEEYAQIWFTKTGKPASKRLLHDDGVIRAVFSSDGKYLLTCSEDRFGRIWDAYGGKLLVPLAHTAKVTFGSFSFDGKRVMTATEDGAVQLWDVRSGTVMGPERRFAGPLWEARFINNTQVLIAGPSEQAIWNLVAQPGTRTELQSLGQFVSGQTAVLHCGTVLRNTPGTEQRMSLQEWHLREAARSERDHAPFAARYHLKQALEAGEATLDMLARRASANAALGMYEEAEADYRACMTMPAAPPTVLCDYARVLARSQKISAWRDVCSDLLRQLTEITDAKVREDVLWICLLCPTSDMVPDLAPAIPQSPLSSGSKVARGYAYRTGHFGEMTNGIAEASVLLGKKYPAEERVFSALAYARLAQRHISKDIVAEAESWLRHASEDKPIPDTGYSITWQRRLDVERLLEETRSVLNGELQAANAP